ncbi:MAG: hypothetical protein M0R50_09580 [Candidatus Cloacimonetes bacterium]|jgi:hypothetical protein|nr:hypothetical protein [Candidatus Cloacimonadota bacterium]
MNYYQPREIIRDKKPCGLYHYTCRNDDQIWPVGLCAEDCPGHATPEEAREHWREYLIQGIQFDKITHEWPKDKCQVEECNEQATMIGSTKNEPGRFIHKLLCDKHATSEEMSKFIDACDTWSSY